MSTPYGIDQERWAKLDIFNQMGNIYSEVGRSFKTQAQANKTNHDEALARAIDLFDATIAALIKKKSPQAREVSRSKEQFLTVLLDNNASQQDIQSLDRYFMQFAVAARINR
jgi:DNA anti-recombination protein RmuC